MNKFFIAAALASVVGACAKSDNSAQSKSVVDSVGGSVAPVTAAPISSSTVPKPVVDVGTYGENVYDQVKASNWALATATMDSLDASAKALKPEESASVTGTIDTLRRAIAAKHRDTALEAANRITYLAAKMSEPYKPPTPVAIVMLDYYGRELEVWSSRKDMAKLRTIAADLRQTWESVKPTVVGAGATAAAATTDSLVAKLSVAKSAAEYAKLATPLLNVVDELEKPFAK